MHKKALTVAIAGALAAPMAAQAVDFTVSGHVNRAVVFTDMEDGSTSVVKDNGSSGTRIRVTGSAETMTGVVAGINFEVGQDNAKLRKASVSFSGEFGKLVLGLDGEAADGLVYNDKSGVFGIAHGQEKGSSALAKAFFPGGMGGGSKEGVHFSTASVGPATLYLSAVNDDRYSAKVSFSGDAGIASYGGALGYLQWEDGALDKSEIAGSLGLKLSSGVTFSVAGATWSDDADGSFVQSTVGYVFGNNAVAVSYYNSTDISDDMGVGGGNALGIGFKHTLPKANVEIIAAVQQYSADYDSDGNGSDDMDGSDTVAVIGSRIKF
jgi:hypothetical protein